jgi:hypothetical protein
MMTDEQKIQMLVDALNKINKIVFVSKCKLSMNQYFDVRETAVNAIRDVGKEVK